MVEMISSNMLTMHVIIPGNCSKASMCDLWCAGYHVTACTWSYVLLLRLLLAAGIYWRLDSDKGSQ
jgi:hypothetical protein